LEGRKIVTYLAVLLTPFFIGALLNFFLFYSQFRGGFPISWFFRYSTGEGYNTITLHIDWTALTIDLFAFFVLGLLFVLVKEGLDAVRRETEEESRHKNRVESGL